MQVSGPLATSVLCAGVLLAQSGPAPSVEINYPGPNANRYINLTPDDFGQRRFAVNSQGLPGEMSGALLAKLLETAGWGRVREEGQAQYLVRIEGDETATLSLSDGLRRSLDYRVWLVTEHGGKPGSTAEAPSAIAVGSGGAVGLRVKQVRRIRVVNVQTGQPIENAEFGRLSGYEKDASARTLWKEYRRVDGIPLMMLTRSREGRPEKRAVFLSEQVSKWSAGRLQELLGGSVAAGVDPEATVERGGTFTVVRIRFPL